MIPRILVTLTLLAPTLAAAQDDPAPTFDLSLAKQGVAFLKTYCQRCHGDDFRYPALDVSNRATLLAPTDKKALDPAWTVCDLGCENISIGDITVTAVVALALKYLFVSVGTNVTFKDWRPMPGTEPIAGE